MNREYHKGYSQELHRDMEALVFGHAGMPVLVFPTSMGKFFEYEDRGMIGTLAPKIERGEIQVFCPDAVDTESWYNKGVHPRVRVMRHLQYERYLLHEFLPFIRWKNQARQLGVTGCSFGGYHCVNFALKHPDIVTHCVSMRADFQRVDRLSQKVVELVRKASKIRATTAAGTNLTAELNPNYKWLKTSGIISPEKWGNLPGGEIFTTPGEVNGTFVIDGVVGDYLCAKFGNLRDNPLTIHIKGNRLTEAHSDNRELQDDFWKYTHTDPNSDRVGEFAIGTNIDLKDVIGQILQDEKYPGVHIAFGNPYGAHTGADWDSTTHIDVVGRKFNIWVDDQQIMRSRLLRGI